MKKMKGVEWVLRIAIFGTFLGHGIFALQGKESWIGWVAALTGWNTLLATQALFFIGLIDISVAVIVLLRPVNIVLLWAVLWAFWTALMRPLPFIGDPIWDFVERWANWGAPLALLLLRGWPRRLRDWFK